MTLESSQTWTVASRSGGASFCISAKGVTIPPSIDATVIEACEVRRSIPRLWRWLIGVDSTSTKYPRLYCSHIGLSRTDLVNTKLRKLLGTVLGGHITPEHLRDRTETWISESLEHRKALPSTRLDTQQCPERQDADTPKQSAQPIYRPLDQHEDTMRLLTFDHKRTSGTIEANLALSRLSNTTAYRAVSYEWGIQTSNESSPAIILNGHRISIQPNLHRFLTRLQQYDDQIPPWVDALCTNQADDAEKSKQVALMGDIYHRAESVLVWLGEGSKGTSSLLRLMNGKFPLRLMQLDDVRYRTRHPSGSFWSLSHPFDTLVKEMLSNTVTKQLLTRTYWTRAWIMQELVLARKIVLFCGDQEIDFQHLDTLLIRKRQSEQSAPHQISMMRLARRNANLKNYQLADHAKEVPPRDRSLEDRTGWLPYLMEMFETTECSRRHDKVYSLLGLSHFAIVPDYSISKAQLFHQTFNTFIRDRKPKYAEILRRALDLSWEELLRSPQNQQHGECSLSLETSFWWDFAWGAAVAEVSTPANSVGVDNEWHSFETDYIERHKDMNGFHPHMERYSMETRGCTRAPLKPGNLLLGLAGTALVVILSEAEGDGKLIGLALMVGTGDAPGGDIARVTYHKVLSLDFLTKDSLAGDCYKSRQFPVRLCVYQFITLLACAVPEYDTKDKLPMISIELLRDAMLHGTNHSAAD